MVGKVDGEKQPSTGTWGKVLRRQDDWPDKVLMTVHLYLRSSVSFSGKSECFPLCIVGRVFRHHILAPASSRSHFRFSLGPYTVHRNIWTFIVSW